MLSDDFTSLESTLTSKQRIRHQEFNSPTRAKEYLLGRWLCNQLSPHQCEDDDDGLPFIPAAPQLRLNITHSRNNLDLLIAAVLGDGLVGIDGEITTRKRNIEALSKHWFSYTELAWMDRQNADKALSFLLLWTAKEALIKSKRQTLAEQLKQTHLAINDDGKMSNNESSVSHFQLADDFILAIAHADHISPTNPAEISVPIDG